ncbi:TlpA family protein disulfide reductase [Amaricoccus sp. W119]|uniref:TlpA family protein disulfide reductase n=1 Tax=Amaricoccus sp. W119 TaxID=3391833 RepID=UPI0039A54A4B
MPVAPTPESRGQTKHIRTAALASMLALVPVPLAADELGPWSGGDKRPLALDLLGGGEITLPSAGAAEGPVIVHFFATWCPPCVPELSALDRLAADRPNLRVITIDVGEVDARVSRFLESTGIRLPVAMDRHLAGARAWDVAGLPASFVFTGSGAPVLAADGDVAWDGAATRARLDALTEPTGLPDR